MKTETYTIPAEHIDAAKDAVEKLNRKAEKLGLETRATLVLGDVRRIDARIENVDECNVRVVPTIEVCDVTLTAGPIAIAGWTFLAHIDHRSYVANEETKVRAYANVVTSTRERELTEAEASLMATCPPSCDHCGHDRFRKATYFVRNESGEEKQVGSTCVADFLGHDPHALLWMLQRLNALASAMADADDFFGGRGREEYDLLEVLASSAQAIRRFGWISAKKKMEEGGKSTKDYVIDEISGTPIKETDLIRIMGKEETVADRENDWKIAKATLEWVRELAPRSEYEFNLCNLAKLDYIVSRDFGLACSAVAVFLRQQEKKAEAKASKSEYLGEVGQRLKGIDAKVVAVRYCEGYMGRGSQLVTFASGENLLKTFYAGSTSFETGKNVKLTGTVKKHEEYNGVKSTMLTRVAIA